eukprot:scaffold4963_cov87-Cylindrotheca_fusiformis.AAC.2
MLLSVGTNSAQTDLLKLLELLTVLGSASCSCRKNQIGACRVDVHVFSGQQHHFSLGKLVGCKMEV